MRSRSFPAARLRQARKILGWATLLFLGVALACLAAWLFWPWPPDAIVLMDNMVMLPDASGEPGKEWWLEVAVNVIGWPAAFAAAASGALYVVTLVVAALRSVGGSKPETQTTRRG